MPNRSNPNWSEEMRESLRRAQERREEQEREARRREERDREERRLAEMFRRAYERENAKNAREGK